ncbi:MULTISPECIES: ABC transporter ATP-binding protein [Burkholderia]|jgi:lipopolysaccharide transport system ATP-binding protein|uniref:ABC transporter ATP-binding protein n=2 Tax=Burkholderia contaminans TaxID=488447 RepID=A0A1E3FM93_9BURK|nr:MULTISPECIES: ABC transporter ATP-binding protein [Burkholderia]UTP21424.1 ABC transporter ATP-binding protein [Burkholderia sp. FXe9]KKL39866.1 sugar ABC transporter ATP-binding protein [Burkholderia contaminans LMG 23361]MBA9828207.1 ABC transporter ATP-binding protein [Burkholderia contaminans]MBA9836756.1 ABC transporter ATP-binding protein [Burkholderia contaminans]MBA9863140.1 ABC transporter ATP-binding protein [Burkholderia contaminans]
MGTIVVRNLGKAYKKYPSRWSRLLEWLDPRGKPRHELHWVQQGLNFEVRAGEAVGIIGMNGAGKSTLLKMIVGTTQPTTGSVEMTGRVAALLELGMGFHPDFTGRQNAIMAGQLLGMSVEEILTLMPDIEAFAEIGEYIDEPVRVYSSGMQVRLAFAVATARRPDVLIVDEALSVGDAYFQHKSFDRIREFRKRGTTLLIVSHDKQAIQSICDRAILLDAGKLAMEGEPEAVMDYYNALLADHQNQSVQQEVLENGKVQTVSGTGEAVVEDIALLDINGKRIEVVDVGQSVTLRVDVRVHAFIERLVLGYGIKDRLGQVVYGTNTDLKKQPLVNVRAGSLVRFNVNFSASLGAGTYSIQTALVSTDTHLVHNYEWRDLALVFNVINVSKPTFVGLAWIDPEIGIEQR